MNEYDFVLRFQLLENNDQPERYLDTLYEAGCDDATIGVGLPGYIALDFCRVADSAEQALLSAIRDVKRAIPSAKLTEVTPDLLNISEIADLVSSKIHRVTRQAMRNYALGKLARINSRFPAAAVTSSSPLWHVDEVVSWMADNEKVDKVRAQGLIELSRTARALNAKLQSRNQQRLSSFDAIAL